MLKISKNCEKSSWFKFFEFGTVFSWQFSKISQKIDNGNNFKYNTVETHRYKKMSKKP